MFYKVSDNRTSMLISLHFTLCSTMLNFVLFLNRTYSFKTLYIILYTFGYNFPRESALHCASPHDQLKCHLLQKASTPSTASNTHRYAKLPVSSSLQGPHMITFIRHYINQIAFSITTSYTFTQSTIVGPYLLYLSFLQSNQNVNVNLVPKLHHPFFFII